MSFQVGKEEGGFLVIRSKKRWSANAFTIFTSGSKGVKVNKIHESEQRASQTNLFDS